MRPVHIESWALSVIDRVEGGQPNEDTRVELKANWIDPHKAARRIAGHANAARGDSILWLVGVDEKRGVVGVAYDELANWHSKVVSQFDGIAPTMIDINVPYGNQTVVALLFETDRAPFVVKNPDFGNKGVSISHEVPWREGTKIRTANRSDLIRLLVPALSLPEVETLGGELRLRANGQGEYSWHLALNLYVTPQVNTPLVIPFHRCEVKVRLSTLNTPIVFENVSLNPPDRIRFAGVGFDMLREPDSYTMAHTQHELIIQGPGRVNLSGQVQTDEIPAELEHSIGELYASLFPAQANNRVVIANSLVWNTDVDSGMAAQWAIQPGSR